MIAKVLFLAFATLFMAQTSIAATTANVALFLDPSCATPAAQPWSISMPFSPKCQSLPTQPPRSLVLDCESDNKQQQNFTFFMYNMTSTCSTDKGGILQLGLQSYGGAGDCLKTQMFNGDKEYTVYSQVKCVVTAMRNKRHLPRSLEYHQRMVINMLPRFVDSVITAVTSQDESS